MVHCDAADIRECTGLIFILLASLECMTKLQTTQTIIVKTKFAYITGSELRTAIRSNR